MLAWWKIDDQTSLSPRGQHLLLMSYNVTRIGLSEQNPVARISMFVYRSLDSLFLEDARYESVLEKSLTNLAFLNHQLCIAFALTKIGHLLETTDGCRQSIEYRPESHTKMLISLIGKLQGKTCLIKTILKTPLVTSDLPRRALPVMRVRCGIECVSF